MRPSADTCVIRRLPLSPRRYRAPRSTLLPGCLGVLGFARYNGESLLLAGNFLQSPLYFARTPLRRLPCILRSAASSSFGGKGPPIFRGGGSGDEGGGRGGGEGEAILVAPELGESSTQGSDVIILDVGGMSCGGCAASVKRILESQPEVSSASVNLATETAIVWPTLDVKWAPDLKQQVGEKLANHLTTCGFKSSLRDPVRDIWQEIFRRKMDEKFQLLKESGQQLAVSWALCAVCLLGHVVHFFGHGSCSWIQALHSTSFHFTLSIFTFLGPGRKLIIDGLRSLAGGSPNMNTLVGLGALSSFGVSCIAAFLPKLGWRTFFEEPIMLIAFVLLGKNLEQRAKLKAASDMTGLLNILPKKARLLIDSDAYSIAEIQCSSLAVGDHIVVLPGDHIPADGIVTSGRSVVDESSFTGEPMPVTKLPGAEVMAGSINLNGSLTIEVKRPGGETSMGDILRLVEEAQTREAPVQRLADKVSGRFTYGVMAISAATFVIWNILGSRLVPAGVHGSSTSLALQLACSVLVIACPCALGLATPTAVLVGTSLGATRGLLLRGGDALESLARVNTFVFDKTGTLTKGKPVVTKVVVTPYANGDSELSDSFIPNCSELEILRFASGVESNTNHPVGRAIIEAALAAKCNVAKVTEGSFTEEPGSGVTATIEGKVIAVGNMSWLMRHGLDYNKIVDAEPSNQSVVYVGINGVLAGLIYVEDRVREDAHCVVESLYKQGIDVYMLSGDKRSSADYVASTVGISLDKVYAGVRPEEKKHFISKLRNENKVVAMVGDGINDAAALASSNVGIALVEGVGAASDVSSIVLMGNRLSQLIDALELSRSTMKTVKQNLWWAFAYNIIGIPIAAGALLPISGIMLTPSIAGALMGLSSVGVMFNSLLLRSRLGWKHESNFDFLKGGKQATNADVSSRARKAQKSV